MTIYLPDLSAWNTGVDLNGALAAALKITEGTGYVSPAYRAQVDEAARHGTFQLAYHFLHQGSAAQQADFCRSYAGTTPLMQDVESTTMLTGEPNRRSLAGMRDSAAQVTVDLASMPGVADICTFTDRYRARGGITWWVYLPRWYWQAIGSPSLKPLADRGLMLWSSDYGVPYTDAGSGRGWQGYGGMTALTWQYSSTVRFGGQQNVDFSAFRGSRWAGKQDAPSVKACLAEFRQLTVTGSVVLPDWAFPPVRYLTVVSVGPHSVRLAWYSPSGGPPVPLGVGSYDITVQRDGKTVPGYPRHRDKNLASSLEDYQFGGLAPGTVYTASVRAAATGGGHASEWATVPFQTPAA